MLDTIVEVTLQEGQRRNVQMKSYSPSNSKKKGATTELRKHPDYEFDQVQALKSILTNLLDRFIAGETIEKVFHGSNDVLGEKETIFSCDICNYKTKSRSGLKTHKTRIHKIDANKCSFCDFEGKTKSKLEDHLATNHTK